MHKEESEEHKNKKKLLLKIPSFKQLKYSYKILTNKEKKLINLFLFLIAVSFLWLGISYYFEEYKLVPKKGGQYIEGLIGSPTYINPILAQTNDVDLDLTRLIFSGLLKYDKNQKLVPDLAEKYEINKDKTKYTFYLRKDIFWQGKEKFAVTADDVIFTLSKIKDPDIASPLFASFQGISAKKINDYTIEFKLDKPFAPFPSLLTFGIIPKKFWENIETSNFRFTELNQKPIGSGPMQVKKLQKDRTGNIKSITLIPNPYYYDKKPYINKLIFKFYPSIQDAIVGLETKEIEGLSFVPKKNIKQILKKNKNLKEYSLQLPQYTALFFNPKNNNALEDINFRLALAHSINKIQILEEALGEEGKIINAPILPGMLGYNKNIKAYEFNLTKANQLLDNLKWKRINIDDYIKKQKEKLVQKKQSNNKEKQNKNDNNNDNPQKNNKENKDNSENSINNQNNDIDKNLYTYPFLRQKKNNILKLTITTVDLPENIKTANLIKNTWKQLGIITEVKIIDPNEIKNDVIKNRNYEILLFGHIIGADSDPYPFWHSSQLEHPGLNLSIFTDSQIDNLLVKAREEKDNQKRNDYYQKFQEILHNKIFAIFLYNPNYNYLIHKKILGVNAVINIITPADRFNNFQNWYIKTKRQKKN